jgi:hypothetical protein
MAPQVDYFLDGKAHGDVAGEFAENNYDPGLHRPFINRSGLACVTVNRGKHYDPNTGKDEVKYETMTLRAARRAGFRTPMIYADNATILRKDEWIMLDEAALRVARPRLRVWSDLAASNTLSLDGMSIQILEHETMSDAGEAIVDMDGVQEGRTDRPRFQLEGMPLPITYSPFFFTAREIATSRRKGQPLSTLQAEQAARQVADTIEQTTLGTTTGLTFGTAANYSRGPTVFGYTNHPSRNTVTLTTPTGSNSQTTLSEVLAMRSTLYGDNMFGPFTIYNGTDWDVYLDDDHVRLETSGMAAPNATLRDRLRRIEGISDVRRADFLSPTNTGGTFDLLMVSLGNGETARAVIGMPPRLIQWGTKGDQQLNFKYMAIMAPQVRSDFTGQSGINHGQAS